MPSYGAPFVKILYLTDLAQKLLFLAEIAISACRDVICGRDSYLCQRCSFCAKSVRYNIVTNGAPYLQASED